MPLRFFVMYLGPRKGSGPASMFRSCYVGFFLSLPHKLPTASLPISHISGAIADEYTLSGFMLPSVRTA
ncbi:hypothetical protein AWJ19_01680 [Paenibacillus sp. DMB5]|nr:hypothetical protein AWJ19_01680 [Paenibacillus sp. DMB5]